MKALARRAGAAVEAASAATTREALGGDVHPGTRAALRAHGVPFDHRRARQMTRADYAAHDLLIAMDAENLRDMIRMTNGDPERKVRRLLSFAGEERDVADPWYTGDFETAYRDIAHGCEALLDALRTRRHDADGD